MEEKIKKKKKKKEAEENNSTEVYWEMKKVEDK